MPLWISIEHSFGKSDSDFFEDRIYFAFGVVDKATLVPQLPVPYAYQLNPYPGIAPLKLQ
jgi:hypothetical protein